MIEFRAYPQLEGSIQSLVERARSASANAYAPYSGFAVGAAVRTTSGKTYVGANLENASYGLSMCAEVAAITAANSSGDYAIDAIAVVGHKFSEPRNISTLVTPCGRCRQLIAEAAQLSGTPLAVFSCSGDLTQIQEADIADLLPSAFGPKNLGLEKTWLGMQAALRQQVTKLANKKLR